jgi:hypothetical protein
MSPSMEIPTRTAAMPRGVVCGSARSKRVESRPDCVLLLASNYSADIVRLGPRRYHRSRFIIRYNDRRARFGIDPALAVTRRNVSRSQLSAQVSLRTIQSALAAQPLSTV